MVMEGFRTRSICVTIIEDVDDIRDELSSFLDRQEGLTCRRTYDSMESFFSKYKDFPLPDIILMDIGLPGISGISGMKLIKEKHPDIVIIMLTVYDDHNRIFEALCAGASGYLLKSASLPKIKESIEEHLKGGAPMSPQIGRKVIDFFSNSKIPAPKSVLTDKEKEVVAGIVEGQPYKTIAENLGISINTARFHIKNIYEKLHVNSRTQVIKKSLKGEI